MGLLDKLLLHVINSQAKKYFHARKFDFSLKGTLELEDMQLNKKFMNEQMGTLPFNIVYSWIDKLKVNAPIGKLESKATTVVIENIKIHKLFKI